MLGYSGRRHSQSNQYTADDGTSTYTGGMTEEEQLASAIRNSLRETGRHRGGGWLQIITFATVTTIFLIKSN